MKIRVLGAGFYGCHIAKALLADGHKVEVHEIAPRIFAGASGNIPARLHIGTHYPRSRMTRAACQEHAREFLSEYGHLTRGVPTNIYAIAEQRSLVDFDQYYDTLVNEVELIRVYDPAELGLKNVEGAVLCGERHILTERAAAYFAECLGDAVKLGKAPGNVDDKRWDWTVDCTFCANSDADVDRYEPCLVVLLEGPTDRAVTIMDGPFPSLYPWDETKHLCSLSSAQWTPFSKKCKTYAEAKDLLDGLTPSEVKEQAQGMVESMAYFYPAARRYRVAEYRTSIRAMPLSGADTRLVGVTRVGERGLRVMAGKIDAIIHAEKAIKAVIE